MKVTIQKLKQWKKEKRPIMTLTAWDYALAQLLDEGEIDIILVGDSLAMVALGHPTTLPVTLDEMIHHTKAVSRGVKRALIVCDLPFLSYQQSITKAIESAGKVLKETEAGAVKIEGGSSQIIDTVAKLTEIGIPVMSHIGLTPQSVKILGYQQQGQTEKEQEKLLNEAIALENAGAFALILEHIPAKLAEKITNELSIPTIGIGAGVHCDGQVLVTADLLGLSEKLPPFAKSYVNLRRVILEAIENFTHDVKFGKFPDKLS
jgi:3-methyl-2-oxobutanoate hydroxymethyltransferase